MIFAIAIMFHGKHGNKGYYSADFYSETCPPTASDKVKKGYAICIPIIVTLSVPCYC